MRYAYILIAVFTTACSVKTSLPAEQNFELERYLGTWYEIARLENRFEKGLSNVTAQYRRREDGGIRVINRGWSQAEQSWEQAEGRAYFIGAPSTAALKVSFFGPFFSPYVVVELDKEHYQYAFVAGDEAQYLWLLARQPEVSQPLKQQFLQQAKELGVTIDNIVWVDQSKHQKTSEAGR